MTVKTFEMIEKSILSFVHIEKAAGQTFIRILENNYVHRHCRVATLHSERQGVFCWDDLRVLLKFNPFIEAIAGHSVMPHSDLQLHVPNIKYITILRNPVERYVSHYQYWVQMLEKEITFDAFLSIERLKNYQVRKIAGNHELAAAKQILQENFFLVGVLDEFEAFLQVLKKKLSPRPFDISYENRNVAQTNKIKKNIYRNFDKYRERIEENNQLDLELYDFVKNSLFNKEKEIWKVDGKATKPAHHQVNYGLKFKREIVGRLYRNLYIGPIINIIRYRNGLKIGGSY